MNSREVTSDGEPREMIKMLHNAFVGDMVVIKNIYDDTYTIDTIKEISPGRKVAVMEKTGLRFGRRGYRYEEEEHWRHKLLIATPDLVEKVEKLADAQYLRSIVWEDEDPKLLHIMVITHKAGKGLL